MAVGIYLALSVSLTLFTADEGVLILTPVSKGMLGIESQAVVTWHSSNGEQTA